jgi:hypothetical protein
MNTIDGFLLSWAGKVNGSVCSLFISLSSQNFVFLYQRICKSIGMSIAWYIQTLRSAFASAATGGLMMARALLQALVCRGITLGGLVKEDDTETSLDEMLSYAFAALGFYFQYNLGFNMPFPFSLLLWPFKFAESYVRWSITNANSIPA